MRFFSYRDRPVHMGSYPSEKLAYSDQNPDLSQVPSSTQISFDDPDAPYSIINAMAEYQAMMDALRDGLVNKTRAVCPEDLTERANHLKSFGYFSDASFVGCCRLADGMMLAKPYRNPAIDDLARDLQTRQTKTLAAGIDVIMAELKESMQAPPANMDHHTHAVVFLYEYPRDPGTDEPGTEWIIDAQAHRAALRGAETAVVIGNYLRLLGYDARVHTGSTADVDLKRLAVASGLASVEERDGESVIANPYIGTRFGLAAVTTTFEMAEDRPLKPISEQSKFKTHGPAWVAGKGFAKNAFNRKPFAKRRFVDGA